MNAETMLTLRRAVEAVRETGLNPDSPGGAIALEHLLGTARAVAPASDDDIGSPPPAAIDDAAAESPPQRMATWAKTTPERLQDLVEFERDSGRITVSTARLPRAKADRQRVLSMLKLSLDRIGFERDATGARSVNALCDEFACADQNLPHNVTSWGDYISRRGSRGSYTYRLSQPGMERAQALWHGLAETSEVLSP
jgi:hypothetical protein